MTAFTYIQGADTLFNITISPVFAEDGTLTICKIRAFYQATFINSNDPTDSFTKNIGETSVDCIKDTDTEVTFTYNGQSYTMSYGLVAAALFAAPAQQWNGIQDAKAASQAASQAAKIVDNS